MTSVRWSQLAGQRVVAEDTKELLGSVRRVLLEPAIPAIIAAQLEGGIGGNAIIDWQSVVTITRHGLTVDRAAAARDASDEREHQLMQGRLDLLGKLVMTELGDSYGQLEDIEIEAETGRLLALHVPAEAVEVDRLIVVGPDMIVVPERSDDVAPDDSSREVPLLDDPAGRGAEPT
jgi:sporulation protein YlmC with PRC-barrel domain